MVHFPLKINQRIQLIKNSWLIIPEKLNNNAEPQNLDPCFNFKYVDSLSPFMYINKSRMNVLSKNILKLQSVYSNVSCQEISNVRILRWHLGHGLIEDLEKFLHLVNQGMRGLQQKQQLIIFHLQQHFHNFTCKFRQ